MNGVLALQLGAVAALAGLLWLAARTWTDHRRSNDDLVPASRTRIGVAVLLALLAPLAMSWGFSVSLARDGNRRVREAEPSADAPARARVFLRAIQIAASGKQPAVVVGFSPTADLALPRHYGVAEAYQRRDLFRIVVTGKRELTVEPLVDSSSDTRFAVSSAATPASSCQSKLESGRCTADGCAVVVCSGEAPKAALVFSQELASADVRAADVPLQVSPWVWSARGWRRHHLQLEAGELIQIGATVDALPGLTIWEVPAPSARPALMFPPDDLLGSCKDWVGIDGSGDGGFFYHPSLGGAVTEEVDADDDFSCFLPFQATQPFALEVRRLVPDVAGVTTRSLWAGLFMAAPALLWLLGLFAARPSQRLLGRLAPAISFAGWSTCLVAIAVIRLLWAHRLDMLRDYEAVGFRVVDNQLHVVFTGAALAASAAIMAGARRWRWPLAACAWSAMIGLGIYAMAVDLPGVSKSRLAAYAAMSILLGAVPGLIDLARPALDRLRSEAEHRPRRLVLAVMALLVGVVAVVALLSGSQVVIVKIALAVAIVSCFYLCLRVAVVSGDVIASAGVLALALAAVVAMAVIDTGVATLYGGVGVLVALIVAGFDALHESGDREQLDHYRAWLYPVVLVSSVIAVATFAVVTLLALIPTGASLLPDPGAVTSAVLGALGLIPVLLAGMATLVGRRRGWSVAGPWLVAAIASLGAWLARGGVLSMAVGSEREAAKRIAAVVDPGYAILQDDAAFSRSLTAWREASLVGPERAAELGEVLGGQGFFGAQVLDPGVLLSVDNDYLPVLIVRELGALGLALLVLLLVASVAMAIAIARSRLVFASAAARWRTIAGVVALVVIGYQPIASLGGLPFTGVSLLGLGIDSPSDWWVWVALLGFLCCWGRDFGSGEQAADDAGPTSAQRLWPRVALFAGCLTVVVGSARAGSFA
ncbi:MAG: hypothetical protein KJO07_07000, partial [Deltaproteobacteria bacterium]|nr:hypothetical protein [Deltaproteobacteria bacterium]